MGIWIRKRLLVRSPDTKKRYKCVIQVQLCGYNTTTITNTRYAIRDTRPRLKHPERTRIRDTSADANTILEANALILVKPNTAYLIKKTSADHHYMCHSHFKDSTDQHRSPRTSVSTFSSSIQNSRPLEQKNVRPPRPVPPPVPSHQ